MQVKDAFSKGFDAARLLEGLLEYFRNLIVCKSSDRFGELIELSPAELSMLSKQAERIEMARCLAAMEVLSKAYDSMRWAKNARLVLEMAMIRLSHPKAEEHHLLARVERLESLLDGTSPVPSLAKKQETKIGERLPEQKEDSEKPSEPAEEQRAILPDSEKKTVGIAESWTEIVHEIERQGNPLLSGALRSGEFRVKGGELHLLGLLPMIDTPQNKLAIQKAVKEVCNTEVEIVIVPLGQSAPKETAENTEENNLKPDRLQEIANRLSGKINIIS